MVLLLEESVQEIQKPAVFARGGPAEIERGEDQGGGEEKGEMEMIGLSDLHTYILSTITYRFS